MYKNMSINAWRNQYTANLEQRLADEQYGLDALSSVSSDGDQDLSELSLCELVTEKYITESENQDDSFKTDEEYGSEDDTPPEGQIDAPENGEFKLRTGFTIKLKKTRKISDSSSQKQKENTEEVRVASSGPLATEEIAKQDTQTRMMD